MRVYLWEVSALERTEDASFESILEVFGVNLLAMRVALLHARTRNIIGS